jgi:hypothetical protein
MISIIGVVRKEKERIVKVKQQRNFLMVHIKTCDHNHSPQAIDGDVNAVASIKQQAKETREQSVQIIQSNIANISEEITPYMPCPSCKNQTR